jgi:glycerol-3-phosphate cytidylyltransferase-like family protein
MPDTIIAAEQGETDSLRIAHPKPVPHDGQRAYTRADQRFVRDAVRGRKEDAVKVLVYGVCFVVAGIEAGADRDFLTDTAKGLHDAVSKLVAGMRKDLDDAYLPPEDADIDMGELDAIIARIA